MLRVSLNQNTLHPKKLLLNKAPSTGSLNCKVRIDELKRIWGENQKILGKISTIKTHYPVSCFKKEANQYTKIKKNMAYNSNRFERNNYFLSLDRQGCVLGSGHQRVFSLHSPFTNYSMKGSQSTKALSRPQSSQVYSRSNKNLIRSSSSQNFQQIGDTATNTAAAEGADQELRNSVGPLQSGKLNFNDNEQVNDLVEKLDQTRQVRPMTAVLAHRKKPTKRISFQ